MGSGWCPRLETMTEMGPSAAAPPEPCKTAVLKETVLLESHKADLGFDAWLRLSLLSGTSGSNRRKTSEFSKKACRRVGAARVVLLGIVPL